MQPSVTDVLRSAVVTWTPRTLLCIAVAFLLAFVWTLARRGPAMLCPGPRRRRAWMFPWAWVRRAVCGYELTGLVAGPDGAVRCPECGTMLGLRDRRRRSTVTWRFEALAAFCVLGAIACHNAPYVHGGQWLARLPTPCLLAIESIHPSDWTDPARTALQFRLWRGELSPWAQERLLRIAVDQLGEDDVRGNAGWARSVLVHAGDSVLPTVERALDSTDWQRRQLAADLLRRRCDQRSWLRGEAGALPAYEPPDRLFEVTVEGLRDDNLPYDWSRRRDTWVSNGFDGMEYLARTGPRAAPACERALGSDDAQQRLLAASALGMMGSTPALPRAARILIAHLADNGICGDARLAVTALSGFGREVVPWIEPCLSSADSQTRALADGVIALVTDRPLTRVQKLTLETISGRYDHPFSREEAGEWYREAAMTWRRSGGIAWAQFSTENE